MQIVIDISKDRYDQIMSMDWKNGRRFFDEELRAIHDGKALKQEPSSSENPNKWIPVSERLPELLEDVLMCDSGGDMAIGYYRQGRYVDGREYFEWYSYVDDEYDFCPTAWMPLPEPYKSEIPTGAEGSEE